MLNDLHGSRLRVKARYAWVTHGSICLLLLICSLCLSCTSTSSDSLHQQGFSNSSLKGTYVYTLGGLFTPATGGAPYQESGIFVADGSGHITGGEDDFVQLPGTISNPVSGTYTIAPDGTGMMALQGSRQVQLAITVVSGTKVYLIEYDDTGNGAGSAVLQSSNGTSQMPSGTFAFRFHSNNFDAGFQASVSTVGSITCTAGQISGNADILRAGVFSSTTLTGSLLAPDSSGRGTASLTDGSGLTSMYIYHMIDPNTINFLETDLNSLGGGRAELQNSASFSNASFAGNFAFRSQGDTLVHNLGVNTVGAFTSDGNGTITAGTYDSVQDGTPTANVSIAGSYSVDPQGRAMIGLTSQGSSLVSQIAWLVSPTRAFFLVNSTDRAEDGTMDQQQNTPFSASSTNGQYAFYMYGYDQNLNIRIDRVGTIVFDDGQTTIAFNNYYMNHGGTLSQTGSLGVSYTTGAGGRLFASPSGITNALVLYLTSNTSSSLILGDVGLETSGLVEQQVVP
jgi:hypothetical protein